VNEVACCVPQTTVVGSELAWRMVISVMIENIGWQRWVSDV